jgi:hypothetical protein
MATINKCRECRFNVRGSDVCRRSNRRCWDERSKPRWRIDRCGKSGRWWQPKIARKRKNKVVPTPVKEVTE